MAINFGKKEIQLILSEKLANANDCHFNQVVGGTQFIDFISNNAVILC